MVGEVRYLARTGQAEGAAKPGGAVHWAITKRARASERQEGDGGRGEGPECEIVSCSGPRADLAALGPVPAVQCSVESLEALPTPMLLQLAPV